LAAASGVGVHIDLDDVPLSLAYVAQIGDDRAARMAAVTAGDDYVLLFTSHLALREARPGVPVFRIGRVVRGDGISLFDKGEPVALPLRLGWEHD
jgi:thiamine-monophosphate kinase